MGPNHPLTIAAPAVFVLNGCNTELNGTNVIEDDDVTALARRTFIDRSPRERKSD
jgi:hypothetical protein